MVVKSSFTNPKRASKMYKRGIKHSQNNKIASSYNKK